MNGSLGLFSGKLLFFIFLRSISYTCTQTHLHNYYFFNQESIFAPRWHFILTVPSRIFVHWWSRSHIYGRNIFFFFFTYLKAQLSYIFAKCPGQSTLVLSVNTRRFYITYFMLRCKAVSPRGLRSLRKNDIFVMSLCLSFIQSHFYT